MSFKKNHINVVISKLMMWKIDNKFHTLLFPKLQRALLNSSENI